MLRKRSSGFTLLELIIVVIVIGILASIALPRYIQVAEKGRVAEAKSMLASLRGAQIRYAAQYGTWSGALGTLDTTVTAAGRYFDFATMTTGAVTDPAALIGQATRNTNQNPNLGAYTVQISQDGQLTGTVTASLL